MYAVHSASRVCAARHLRSKTSDIEISLRISLAPLHSALSVFDRSQDTEAISDVENTSRSVPASSQGRQNRSGRPSDRRTNVCSMVPDEKPNSKNSKSVPRFARIISCFPLHVFCLTNAKVLLPPLYLQYHDLTSLRFCCRRPQILAVLHSTHR